MRRSDTRWGTAFRVERHVIRGPVCRERGNRRMLGCARAHVLAAIAAILGSEHEFLLDVVEVAFRPAEVRAALDAHQLFRWKVRALGCRVELRPVLAKLIATMLSGEHAAPGRVDGNATAVANAGREPLLGREHLIGAIRVVAPDARARLEAPCRAARPGSQACGFLSGRSWSRSRDSHTAPPSASIANGCMG